MKSYREEFCLWCYNLGQNRRKIKTPSTPHPPNQRMQPEKEVFWPSRGFIFDLGRWDYILYDKI